VNFHRVRIERVHRLDEALNRDMKGLLFRRYEASIVPADHLRIEIGAIMELHAFPQVEHVNLTVLEDLPGFGQVWHSVPLSIEGEQAIEEIPQHTQACGTESAMGVQAGDIRSPPYPQGASVLGRLGPGRQGRQQESANRGDEPPRATPVPGHRRPSSAGTAAPLRRSASGKTAHLT
jgi:hypothetical protein